MLAPGARAARIVLLVWLDVERALLALQARDQTGGPLSDRELTEEQRQEAISSWDRLNRMSEHCPVWNDGQHCFETSRGYSSPGPICFKSCVCGATVLPASHLLIDPKSPWRRQR